MSSEERPVRQRRRALNLNNEPPVEPERDVFDPGPMVHYPPLPVGPDGLPQAPAIRQRVRDLKQLSSRASMEFILRTLHAFLVCHKPVDEIARTFGVTIQCVYNWRNELYKRIGQELRNKTPTDLIAKQIANLQEVKATAWSDLRSSRDKGERNRSLNTIINTEKAIADLYERVGLIGPTTFKPVVDTTAEDVTGSASTLAKLATEFLEGGYGKKRKPTEKTIEQDVSTPIDDSDYLL